MILICGEPLVEIRSHCVVGPRNPVKPGNGGELDEAGRLHKPKCLIVPFLLERTASEVSAHNCTFHPRRSDYSTRRDPRVIISW